MNNAMPLDDFLSAQGSGFTATIEAIAEKPLYVKVTPFRESQGCGCAGSLELPREAIRSVTGTGKFHFCCGKRLEVVVVEIAEDASVPLADLLKQRERQHDHHGHSHGHSHGHQHGHQHGHEHMGGRRGFDGFSDDADYRSEFARRAADDGSAPPDMGPTGPMRLVGRWRIPWSRCSVSCIEVCTRFCGPTGWKCCAWETRCAINCDGPYFDPFNLIF